MANRYGGKTIKFRVPVQIYGMLQEKIRMHKKYGSYYSTETFRRIFFKGLEVLGSEGVDKIILEIRSKKKEKRLKGKEGGGVPPHGELEVD
jgi:predicted metal-dependent RNase